jgi:glycerol-1-phosphate dehydrogenase [NAD(P)+]
MEALILVGVAMSFAGNSRPASGSEHHLSHFFEITGIVNGTEYLPHGTDVLFSTAITAKIRERLIKENSFCSTACIISEDNRNAEIRRVYGQVADGCIALQKKLGTYTTNRIQTYTEKANEIKLILKSAPTYDEIIEIINGIELNIKDFFDLYTKPHINDAIKYAKDLKDRYTVLWMYFDLFGTSEIL